MKTQTQASDSPKATLSAPWYTIQRILAYTIGQSATTIVSELDPKNYQIKVIALSEDIAKCIANTIRLTHQMGNITVNILVYDTAGNIWVPNDNNNVDFLLNNLRIALMNNPMVYSVSEFNSYAAICCVPQVVQFYNDDLGNPDEFTSMLAAEAFRRVFKKDIITYTLGKEIGNI
ncbi:hypothetical protein [Marinifilum sp.]|uniref:hypothetical protein n=1 Tax=Marinifilum sp. TaxID=2033137 RepID=UPI003BA9A663